jgi:hypothetical protein
MNGKFIHRAVIQRQMEIGKNYTPSVSPDIHDAPNIQGYLDYREWG